MNILAPPSITSVPSIAGTPAVGQTLAWSSGAWSNSPTGYAYQWNAGGVAIGGATQQTYVVRSADHGLALTCTVTAFNAAGAGTPAVSGGVYVPVPACSQMTVSFGVIKAQGCSAPVVDPAEIPAG